MAARPTLEVILSMVDNLSAPLRATATTVAEISTKMTSALQGIGEGLAAVFTVNFARGALDAAAQLEGAMADIRNAVGTTKSSWNEAQGSIDATLDSLDKLTNFTRTDLAAGLARMIQSTGDVTVAEEGLALAADIAKARHLDLQQAVDIVAKAADGNATAFKRMGITLQDNETPMQALIRVFGDFTSNEGPNARDTVASVGKAWDEFKVSVGQAMLAQNAAGGATNTFAEIIRTLRPIVAGFFGNVAGLIVISIDGWKMLGDAAEAVWYGIGDAVKIVVGGSMEVIGKMVSVAGAVLPGIGDAYKQVGASLQQTGATMVTNAKADWQNIKQGFTDNVDEILGYDDKSTTHQKGNYDALVAAAIVAAGKKTSAELTALAEQESNLIASLKRREADAAGQDKVDLYRRITAAEAALAIYTNGAAKRKALAQQSADDMLAIDKQLQADIQKDQAQFFKDFAEGTQSAEGLVQAAIDSRKAQITTWQTQLDALTAANTGHLSDEQIQLQKNITTAQGEVVVYRTVLPIFAQINDLATQGAQIMEHDNSLTADHQVSLMEIDAVIKATNDKRLAALGNTDLLKTLEENLKVLEGDRATILGRITPIVGDQVTATGKVTTEEEKLLVLIGKVPPYIKVTKDGMVEVAGVTKTVHDNWKQGADEAVRMAEQVGLIDKTAGTLLTSAIGVADAFEKAAAQSANFTQNLSLGSVTSLAGAALTLGSAIVSIFSNPAGAAERALIAKNNDALTKLTEINGKLVALSDPGTKIEGVKQAITAAFAGGSGVSMMDGGLGISTASVEAQLGKAGLTWQDLAEVAKDMNIDLGTTNTQSSEAMLPLMQALGLYQPTAFASDFTGQISQAAFEHSLTGGSGATLSDYASAASSQSGSPFLASLFQGLDLNNPSDLQTLASRIRTAGGQVNSLTDTQLGSLSTSDLPGILTTIAGLIPAAGATPTTPAPAPVTVAPTVASTVAPTFDSSTVMAPSGLPSAATAVVIADIAGWGFKSLGDFLGPKIDQTNSLLSETGVLHADLVDIKDAIAGTGGKAVAVKKLDVALGATADLSILNAGGAS